ncbi:TapB family protein [Zavarzinella formosa]|uniref:TapB family protein n=1 Tax=Zavarzinella formosa TaxID=360055 RepID=UPI0012F8AE59|nr:hypothetical protein [Zavarzinella formosa]
MRAICVCLLMFAGFAQAEEKTPEDDLYPLEIGNTWTYKVSGQEDRFIIRVAAMEKVGDYDCYRLEAMLRDKPVGTEHLLVAKNGIFRARTDKDDVTPPVCILQFPTKKGTTWKGEYKLGGKAANASFVGDTETVTVPAGKFATVSVQADLAEMGGKVRTTLWFAPNVGVVKQTLEEGKRTLTLELEKFQKAEKK